MIVEWRNLVTDEKLGIGENRTQVLADSITISGFIRLKSYSQTVLLCGCSNGPLHRWELENKDSLGGVISLDNYDITADGLLDLLVGRDDGTVEIYSFDESDDPVRRFKQVN